MNLDDKFIYVFIRQNMFADHQMVHTFHLGFLIGKAIDGFCQKRYVLSGHPSVILIGCEEEKTFASIMQSLSALGIEFMEWRDPDSKPEHDDYGLTGIVTEPITKSTRNKLGKYRPWSDRNNVHPHGPLVS